MVETGYYKTDVHNLGFSRLYSEPRRAMSLPVMMKFAARRKVGLIIVVVILSMLREKDASGRCLKKHTAS